MKPTTCSLYPVPLKLFKSSFQYLSNERIIYTSLHLGTFPFALKTAFLKPLLKKPDLDIKDLVN